VSFISVLVALYYCIKQSGSEEESELSKAHQHMHAQAQLKLIKPKSYAEIHAWTCKRNVAYLRQRTESVQDKPSDGSLL